MRETVFLLVAALLAFGGALWAPFHLDDFVLLSDPVVTSPEGWRECWKIGQTRPLTWLTFWLNYRLGGTNPFGYHLLNLLVHLASVALVRSALTRLISPQAALIAAGLFALHPIQTEAVVYVFARATLLMTLFCLLSLRAWAAGRAWAAVGWFVPAVLAKEECVAFPLFLAVVAWTSTRPLMVMMGISAGAGLRVLLVAGSTPGSGAGSQAAIGTFDYLSTQGVAIWRYARLLALPSGLTPESPLEVTTGIVGAACWAAVVAAVWLAARLGHWRWLAGALLLVAPSTSVFAAEDLSADRRLYLPLMAIGAWIGLRWKPGVVVAGVVACVLTALSFRQTALWVNPQELWRQAVMLAPGKVRPRIQLARNVAGGEAEAVLLQAQELAPNDPRVASELGRLYLEAGRPESALAHFGRALALMPGDPAAMNNRGVALWKMGQIDAAKTDFRRALALDACYGEARRNLGRLGEAIPEPGHCQ